MKLKIEMSLDNEAFVDENDEIVFEEVLRSVMDALVNMSGSVVMNVPVRDINGNTVGTAKITGR